MLSSERVVLRLSSDTIVAVREYGFKLWPTVVLQCAHHGPTCCSRSSTPAHTPGDFNEQEDVFTTVQHFSVINSSSCWGTIVFFQKKERDGLNYWSEKWPRFYLSLLNCPLSITITKAVAALWLPSDFTNVVFILSSPLPLPGRLHLPVRGGCADTNQSAVQKSVSHHGGKLFSWSQPIRKKWSFSFILGPNQVHEQR